MVTFFLLVLAKSLNDNRFFTLLPLFVSDKYLKFYSKEQLPKIDTFNLLLSVVQIIIITMMLSFILKTYGYTTKNNYIEIASILTSFVTIKYFFEKILASIFEIKKFVSIFQFNKISYKNLIPILLLPFLILFIFSELDKKIVISTMFVLFLLLNSMALTLTIKKQQKTILRWFFYFILYLCAFEIIPYLIIIKLLLVKLGT